MLANSVSINIEGLQGPSSCEVAELNSILKVFMGALTASVHGDQEVCEGGVSGLAAFR